MQNSSIVSETSNMAEPINLLFLYLISTLLVLKMVQQCHQVVAKPGGFTIELIHRNSPDSPFYQPNLTYAQRIQTLAHQSITRAQYLKNITALTLASKFSPETARFLINPIQGFALYSIKLGIGTIPTSSPQHKMYNLLVDTGSDLTWLQCEYCKQHNCFQVTDEPFPSTSSTSYKLLPCKAHPLCEGPCIDGSCSFERGYTDESYVNGFLASETFSFDSSSGPAREFVQGLVFGCTIDSNKISFAGDDNEISGVMGLGFGPKAFVNQLNSPQGQSNGRFSYCLRRERIAWPTNSFIKFGADVQQRPDLSVTALRKFNNLVHYYINLVGISVNSNKVNIPDAEFAVRPDGTGGSIIDSGASFTHLRRSVHDAVVGALDAVFAGYGGAVKKVPKVGDAPFELCYEVLNEQEFRGYPVITFHLDNNANLVLDFQSAYLIGKGASGNVQFYFAVIPDDDPKGVNSIGAYQQTNYRFIYDTKEFKLSFGPENCFHST